MEASSELAAPGATSLKERMQHRRAVQQTNGVETLEIPGCAIGWDEEDGSAHQAPLFARYHGLDYSVIRSIGLNNAKVKPASTRELYTAADTLIAACEGVEVHDGDEVEDLGVKLGNDLAEYLNLERCERDRQAVFTIVPDTAQLMVHYGKMLKAFGLADLEIDEELLGN